jgi:hypothetical protein
MFSKQFFACLPNTAIRVQSGASIKLRPDKLLAQYLPGGTSHKKVAIAPATFDNFSVRGKQSHTHVKSLWGIAVDVDHPDKANGGFFSQTEATCVFNALPEDLQRYAWLVWSNGVTIWFFFEQEQTWEQTARFAAKVGDTVQKTLRERGQPGEVENFYVSRTGPGLQNQASHCYRLPGSWASARKAVTETLTCGQKLPTSIIQRYASDHNYTTPEFKQNKVKTTEVTGRAGRGVSSKVSHTILGNKGGEGGERGRGRGSCSAGQEAFKAGLAAFRQGMPLIEVAKAHPLLTAKDLQKISAISAATGKAHRLPPLPDCLVIARPLCAMQKRMQRTFNPIAWVGWINFYARMEKWTARQTWDYIHNSLQFKQLSKILLQHWTYEHFENDFHHCAQVFGEQAPSDVSIGVICKVSTIYAKLQSKSVRAVAKACGISKSTAARALAALAGRTEAAGEDVGALRPAVGAVERASERAVDFSAAGGALGGAVDVGGVAAGDGGVGGGFTAIGGAGGRLAVRVNPKLTLKTGLKVFEWYLGGGLGELAGVASRPRFGDVLGYCGVPKDGCIGVGAAGMPAQLPLLPFSGHLVG